MADLQDAAIQVAETLQTAHIRQDPTVEHDINPSTSVSGRQPVHLDDNPSSDALSEADDAEEDEIPVSLLRPAPRRPPMPALPDLRFEQSYLASIKEAKGWQGVALITIRDQVMMPLIQGLAWTLIVAGWKTFNASSTLSGQSMGARIRRWWWGVNNWEMPKEQSRVSRR
ncbi:hypothetical protein AMS68_001887 [Peltaster fructicola]|uniref:DUF1770-domain-containing protein n=1 Tax=Peltaster fructicola TaxID=286661 RepID=A0A6H0XPG2_9PEZI|nr:hypothetical protein AMS68_001887 [Peltaster fructicola]